MEAERHKERLGRAQVEHEKLLALHQKTEQVEIEVLIMCRIKKEVEHWDSVKVQVDFFQML